MKDDTIIRDVTSKFQLPPVRTCDNLEAIKRAQVPRLLILNYQVFSASPPVFGTQENDPGISSIMYFAIKPGVVKDYESGKLTPAMKLFKRFVAEFEDNEKMQKRFKAIAIVENLKSFKFLSRFEGYNGKPFILNKSVSMRKIDRVNYDYLEIDINVRLFGYVAKKMIYSFIDEFKYLKVSFGILIQAETDEEMPENMIGVVKCHRCDIYQDSIPLSELS